MSVFSEAKLSQSDVSVGGSVLKYDMILNPTENADLSVYISFQHYWIFLHSHGKDIELFSFLNTTYNTEKAIWVLMRNKVLI